MIDENPSDVAQYQLDKPRLEVTFKADGKTHTLKIGRKTPPEASPLLSDVEKAEINTRHVRAMKYLVAGMAVLVVAGIAIDVFTAPRTSFALGGAAAPGGKR